MIRQVSEKEFAICYPNGEVFERGFGSEAHALERFWAMRPFDRMVVTGQPPGERTDRGFLAGTENGRQFEKTPHIGEYYRKVAESKGQNVKGKKYLGQLADYPGDPRAWVDGRGDIQRRCEEKGWGCTGTVKTKRHDVEPSKGVDIAPDLLERYTRQEIAKEGGVVSPKRREEIRESVRAKRTRKKVAD